MAAPKGQEMAVCHTVVALPPEPYVSLLCPEIFPEAALETRPQAAQGVVAREPGREAMAYVRASEVSRSAILTGQAADSTSPPVHLLETYEPAECAAAFRQLGARRLIACSGTLASEAALQAASSMGLERIFLPLVASDLLIPASLCDQVWADHEWAGQMLADAGYAQVRIRVGIHRPDQVPGPVRIPPSESSVTIPPLPPDQIDLLLGVGVLRTLLTANQDLPVAWAIHPHTDARLIRNLLRSADLLGRITLMPCPCLDRWNRILETSGALLLPMQQPMRLGWARFAARVRPGAAVIAGLAEQAEAGDLKEIGAVLPEGVDATADALQCILRRPACTHSAA